MNKKRIRMILVMAILSGMLAIKIQGAKKRVKKTAIFSVKDFGARGDGETLDTKAIQKALDECGKAGPCC